jgi:hypothetical protein
MSDLGLTIDDLRGPVNLAICLGLFEIETESVSEVYMINNRLTSEYLTYLLDCQDGS